MISARALQSLGRHEKPGHWFVFALGVAMAAGAHAQKPGAHPATSDTGRPGQYRLLESNDDAVCRSFGKMFSASRSKSGDLDFSRREGKVSWLDLNPPLTDPPTQYADLDIDNDARPERVFRVAWSIRTHYTYALYVQRDADLSRPPSSDRETIVSILKTAVEVDFMEYASLIKRLQTQYGNGWEAWWLNGHVLIEPLPVAGQTYLVAWRYDVKPRNYANAYVFQLTPEGEKKDICMFGRVCTCGGCTGRQSSVERRLLPQDQYCKRPS